jgi:hypothetical protein
MFHFILPSKIILPSNKTKNRVGSSSYKTTDAMSNSGGRNTEYAGMDLSN